MAYLTKEKVKEIIQNAPAGTSPAGIVASLRAQGHELEGFDKASEQDRLSTVSKLSKRVGTEGIGVAKGGLSSLVGLSSLGERGIKFAGRVVTPKKFEERLGFSKFEEGEKTSAEEIVPEEIRTAGEGEKIGFAIEQIAEFFIPIPGLRGAKASIYLNRANKLRKLSKTSKARKVSKAVDVLAKPVMEFKKDKYNSQVKDSLRIWPQDNDTEGFFVCKIKKE